MWNKKTYQNSSLFNMWKMHITNGSYIYYYNLDHCPWMGTCVGHYNRQYFINFLTYVTSVSFFYVQMMREFRLPRKYLHI